MRVQTSIPTTPAKTDSSSPTPSGSPPRSPSGALARDAGGALPGLARRTSSSSQKTASQPRSAPPVGKRTHIAVAVAKTSGAEGSTVVLAAVPHVPRRDFEMSLMANRAYARNDDDPASTYAQELKDAGWTRLTPEGDHMAGPDGQRLDIAPDKVIDDSTGFQAAIYQKADRYAVAYAGTSTKQKGDVETDVRQAFGMTTAQYTQGVDLAQKMERIAGKGKVDFAGQSLGGGLAAAAAVATGEHGVTINAAGLSNETLRDLRPSENANDVRESLSESDQIRDYTVEDEPLTSINGRGAPEGVGHVLNLPLNGTVKNPENPDKALNLHGGAQEPAPYVELMRKGVAEEGAHPNPLAHLALPVSAEATATVIANIGAGVTALESVKSDLHAVGQHAHGDLSSQQGVLQRAGHAPGVAVEALADATGAFANAALKFEGKVVQDITDEVGASLRKHGKQLGLDHDKVTHLAQAIEGAGNRVEHDLSAAGEHVEDKANAFGDWAAKRAHDAAAGNAAAAA